MKEIFLKHKTVIFRSIGAIVLVLGFASYFWVTPKKVYTQNEIAAANVARMEAQVRLTTNAAVKKPKPSSAEILEHLKNTQKAQARYMSIIAMILGVGFLGYSFLGKK
jgi:hypothetical protein